MRNGREKEEEAKREEYSAIGPSMQRETRSFDGLSRYSVVLVRQK